MGSSAFSEVLGDKTRSFCHSACPAPCCWCATAGCVLTEVTSSEKIAFLLGSTTCFRLCGWLLRSFLGQSLSCGCVLYYGSDLSQVRPGLSQHQVRELARPGLWLPDRPAAQASERGLDTGNFHSLRSFPVCLSLGLGLPTPGSCSCWHRQAWPPFPRSCSPSSRSESLLSCEQGSYQRFPVSLSSAPRPPGRIYFLSQIWSQV